LLLPITKLQNSIAMKRTFTILAAATALLSFACKHGERPSESHPLYGDTNVVAMPNGDTVLQDDQGNTIRTVYSAFGPGHNNTTSLGDSSMPIGVEQPYYIFGKLHGGAGASITLDQLNVGSTIKPLFNQAVNKQEMFDFEGMTAVPQLMQLRVPAGSVHFIVKPGDSIELDLDLQTVVTYGIKGSPESQHLFHIYTDILEKANEKKQALDDAVDNASNMSTKTQLMAVRPQRVAEIDKQKYKELKEYITRIGNSYAALAGAMYLNPAQDIEFLYKLDEKFSKIYPNSELYKAVHDKVTIYNPLRIGNEAPEILLETPEGKDYKLSDTRGKKVLVFFWSSYNEQSVKELDNLIPLYEKYKAKGFEVYAVSLDNNRDTWTKTIKDHKWSWVNVSDMKAQNSQAAQAYLISNIPATYLLDKEGKMVARDLHGATLEKAIKALF
jgi:peroxiredoxin